VSGGAGVLRGKAVVVTGAAQGLGRAYAMHAAAEGAEVVVNDVRGDLAKQVVDEIHRAGGTAIAVGASVASWPEAQSVIQACVDQFGRIDGLVNNAGIMPLAKPWDLTKEDIDSTIAVNLTGAIYCGVHAMRAMGTRGGVIVNVTSGAQMGRRLMSVYGASRAGTAALTYSWALDCAERNIRVNAIWPGAVTGISAVYRLTAEAASRTARPGVPPEANAPLVTFLLSDLAEGIAGQVIALRGPRLTIVSHPSLTPHSVTREDGWSLANIADAFATTLRHGLEPIGAPD
jgi:NAD(P)-dependent dehydrogenase (short-subunit alcohol dehydrogenase family)